MTARGAGPVGLGGWLWPVTWLSAVLPVLLLPLTAGMLWRLLSSLRYSPWFQKPVEVQSEYIRGIAFGLMTSAVALWWASQWFARAPRLRVIGPTVLATTMLGMSALMWPDRSYPSSIAILVLGWTAVVLAWWAAHHSRRVRNTFVAGALPVHGAGGANVLRDGPGDWSARRWLVPGVLAYAALRLLLETTVSVGAVREALPTAAELAAMGNGPMVHDPTRYILASRTALALQLAAIITLAVAGVALARGSKWCPVLTVSAVLLALGAAVRMAIRDWCCPFVDGPRFEEHVVAWLVALGLALIGAIAWRRPRATPHAE